MFVVCVVAFVSHGFCLFGCGLLLIPLCVVVLVVCCCLLLLITFCCCCLYCCVCLFGV